MKNIASTIARLSPEKKAELKQNPGEYNLFPLSHAQERLWFLDQLLPGTPNYNMPAAIEFHGQLDLAALEFSLNTVVERHEALRTAFLEIDGVPMQLIQAPAENVLKIIDFSALDATQKASERERHTREEAGRAFDLNAGYLFRWTLMKWDAAHHVLLVTLHHIVSDDWSHGVLMREISMLYRTYTQGVDQLPEPAIQYVDFACWHREQLQGEALESLLAYWRGRLSGTPEMLSLPLDRPRPAVQTFRGERMEFVLDTHLTQRLAGLARDRNVTLFMVLLAAFKILLQRYSGQNDIVVATPIANRNTVELEALIGLFFNTLVLRTEFSSDLSFVDVLNRVRDTALDAYAHQELPFVKLIEALKPGRALSHNPLVQVMFILQNAPRERFELPGLRVEIGEVNNRTAQFDLIVALRQEGKNLSGYVHYNTDIFDAATMSRLVGHFKRLLVSAVALPQAPVSALQMLTPPEWKQATVAWNNTFSANPSGLCLHTLVERQAAAAPKAIAAINGERQLRYAELDARANQLAHRLLELGACAGTNVGICVEPGIDMVIALLAVLKTGCAYVPMDPSYPAERLAFMLEDARIAVLVTEQALRMSLPHGALPTVCVDREAHHISEYPATVPSVVVSDEHLAYVIYTSGTTGRPKGVMVRHAGIVNNLLDLNRSFKVGPADRILALSSFSFDMCVYETFGILAAGGTIIVPERSGLRDPAYWSECISEYQVTIWNSAPALLEMLVRHGSGTSGLAFPALRLAILGGDWVAVSLPDRLAQLAPSVKVVVLGGATEASIHSIVYPIERTDPTWISIPYGRPMANQRAYLLDPALQPVPVGVIGELYLGGEGLARGYFARPGLTAEKFIPDPYSNVDGARMYRTGDLARYSDDGTIILIGRVDHQVKIRGHRIELGEIEAVLKKHPAVKQAVVTTRPDVTGEKRLVAYLVLESTVTSADWVEHASACLPSYMVPTQFVLLEQLPLSPNGKFDHRALPSPEPIRTAVAGPMSMLECLVASLFEEVLGVESVGPDDDFFDLGGHSLRATQLMSQVRDLFQIELPLRTFLEAPDVASLSRVIERITEQSGVSLEPILSAYSELGQMGDEEVSLRLDAHLSSANLQRDVENA